MCQHFGTLEREWSRQLTRPIFLAGTKNVVWERDYFYLALYLATEHYRICKLDNLILTKLVFSCYYCMQLLCALERQPVDTASLPSLLGFTGRRVLEGSNTRWEV